jgi:N-acetylneuraminate lyase
MLRGIFPIVITPFDSEGRAIDEDSLRRVVRFELDGRADGVGVGGFASEAYKLTDEERYLVVWAGSRCKMNWLRVCFQE